MLKFVGGWVFFSITSLIGSLSLAKRFEAVSVGGFAEVIVDQYIGLTSLVSRLLDWIPFAPPAYETGTLIFITWIVVLAPALFAILKQRKQDGVRLWVLLIFPAPIIIIGFLSIFEPPEDLDHWYDSFFEQLTGIIGMTLLAGAVAVKGLRGKWLALRDFGAQLLGAVLLCTSLVLSGLVDFF